MAAALLVIIVVVVFALLTSVVNSQNTYASTLTGLDVETDNVAELVIEEQGVVVVAQAEENATTATNLGATNGTTASPARNNMTGVKFLSIQTAESGTLSQITQINATAYTLELRNVSDKTIFFSDRPDRIVTSVSTSDFVGNWTMGGAVSFSAYSPNAVLVLDDEKGRQEQNIAIIELFNPEYDTTTNTLKYDIAMLNLTSIESLRQFGQSTLVIDDDPVSVIDPTTNSVIATIPVGESPQ